MCDYSLEMYRSRAAEAGDKLVVTMFPTGSRGLTTPTDTACAVCVQDHTVMRVDLSGSEFLQSQLGLKPVEAAEFVHLNTGIYRDGLRFENGVELSLQQLPSGTPIEVAALPVITKPVLADTLRNPIPAE